MRRLLFPMFCAGLMAACGDDATTAGDATPDGTTTPDATANADGTTTPDATTTPDGTTTPDATTTPDGTTTPDATTTPDGTTTPETTPSETTTGDDGAGTCPGILACAVECTTQQCLQTCLGAADNADESGFFNGYINCLDTNSCFPEVAEGEQPTNEQIIASIECEAEHCIDENVECTTGATYGTGTCAGIFTCLNECPTNTDIVCQRECFSAGSEASVTAWYALNYCLNTECYGSDNFQTCAQQAIQNPPCSLSYNACTGGGGASAGAAGGGDFTPEKRREMGELYKRLRQR